MELSIGGGHIQYIDSVYRQSSFIDSYICSLEILAASRHRPPIQRFAYSPWLVCRETRHQAIYCQSACDKSQDDRQQLHHSFARAYIQFQCRLACSLPLSVADQRFEGGASADTSSLDWPLQYVTCREQLHAGPSSTSNTLYYCNACPKPYLLIDTLSCAAQWS